ncbi:MAG: zinc-ribbon domain-containing protein [Anaerolineales bacterium]
MTQKRPVSKPEIPDAAQCPRCGYRVLIGDEFCDRCGYDLRSTRARLKTQPANVIVIGAFLLGIILTFAALTGMENLLQLVFILIGLGLIVGGGLYYAFDLLVLNADDRRKKPGQRSGRK